MSDPEARVAGNLLRSWPPSPCKFLGATFSVCVGFGHVLALISWLLLRSLCPFSIHIHSLLEKFNVPPVCVRSLGVLVLVAVLLEDGLLRLAGLANALSRSVCAQGCSKALQRLTSQIRT